MIDTLSQRESASRGFAETDFVRSDNSDPLNAGCYTHHDLLDILPEAGEPVADGPASETRLCPRYSKSLERLLHPESTPLDKAIHAALILRRNDPQLFFSTFASLCSTLDEGSSERLFRALELLDSLGYYDALLPWLRALTENAHARVRSKAAKLLCKAVPKKLLIERQLRSEDSRVRANAIEALWFYQTSESAIIFRNALSDPCHRVVVNALIGLYRQKDDTAMQKLIALSQHPSELVRAAVIWAFVQLDDDRAIAPLKSLVNDSCEVIREKAAHALAS
jgi:hypothetical protein